MQMSAKREVKSPITVNCGLCSVGEEKKIAIAVFE